MQEELYKSALVEINQPELESTLDVLSKCPEISRVRYENIEETYSNNNNAKLVFGLDTKKYFVVFEFEIKNEQIIPKETFFQSGCDIYFELTSGELSYTALSKHFDLLNIDGWSKGDKRGKKSTYKHSSMKIRSDYSKYGNPLYKLSALLSILESKKDEVNKVSVANRGIIHIVFWHHYLYVHGLSLDRLLIKRIGDLGLPIDIHQYLEYD